MAEDPNFKLQENTFDPFPAIHATADNLTLGYEEIRETVSIDRVTVDPKDPIQELTQDDP